MLKYFSLFLFCLSLQGFGQADRSFDAFPEFNKAIDFRCIGPFRGGRSAAVTGVEGKPMLFYMGSTGGGVWKTKNGGTSWENISDGYFGGSIGAIEVSQSHNNVIYVGGGEVTVRGNVSYGYGVHKSVDGGRSWKHMGLKNSRHIPRIRVHPKNPDIVYAAVLGDLFQPSEERGVFKSSDGGKSWNRVLFANADAGAVDLIMDPENPDILYASTWNVRRTPYSLSSGGEGSKLWKSVDGGANWKDLTANEGFPEGTLGIIGITVSPVDPERLWAIVEADKGGVIRSDDGGKTWELVNTDRSLRQRAWYYSRIYADTKDRNKVYVMNVQYHTSTDGGRTFKARNAPHGDHHDLWIAPEDPDRMVIADDGGAQVTYDGGESWSTYQNQPTAQFYRVTTDDHFPYRIYGAQQDNSTIRIDSKSDWGNLGKRNWESTAGGESAHIAIDPKDNDIVYGGSYGGYLTRLNHHTDQQRAINVWPDNPIGYGAEGMKYRFQWNFPLFFSPHNPEKLYTASQHLHVSMDGGGSWKIISPDLSRNDSSKLVPSGGPITKDNTGVEYYATIFSAIESPYEKDLLWCGSDDGLMHVSKDGGENWENVTPKNLPEWAMINSIEADPFHKGGLYIAATKYKAGDYQPYLYHTLNYGKSWTRITNGIPSDHFTRVIRADRKVEGLLYCGTESGLYVSIDDGKNWKPFQLNLPIVPITDMALKENNLIIATQGRSFWILDDLDLLWQEMERPNALKITPKKSAIYSPSATTGVGGGSRTSQTAGTNHSGGVRIFYKIDPELAEKNVSLKILDKNNEVIRSFNNNASDRQNKFDVKGGTNLFTWNMRYPKADKFDGMLMWWGTLEGPEAAPGTYTARLITEADSVETTFDIILDPRSEGTVEDRQAQFDFLLEIRNTLDETHDAIRHMRELKEQIRSLSARLSETTHQELIDEAERLEGMMDEIEGQLYQTKLKSNQDMLNYPIQLNNKLAHVASLASMSPNRPTQQMIDVKNFLTEKIEVLLEDWNRILEKDVPTYNKMIRDKGVDFIGVSPED